MVKGIFKFDFEDMVQNRITEFTGVVVARSEWLSGKKEYGIQSKKLDDKGTPKDLLWMEEVRLVKMDENNEKPVVGFGNK